jgi:hypothetical protein
MARFRLYLAFTLVSVLASSLLGCTHGSAAQPSTTTSTAVVLTIHDGSIVKTYSLDQIKGLPSTTGTAGTISGAGVISTAVQCKGVALTGLLGSFTGASAGSSIKITGSDGYFVTLTYNQIVQGSFATYGSDGALVTPPVQTTAILEYEENGSALTSDLGPLRLVIISPPGQVARSNLWVKSVDSIDVLQGQ